MSRLPDALLDVALWVPALQKYGAVAQLSVALYDANARLVCGPVPPTPIAALFQHHSFDRGFAECARQCLGQVSELRPPVIVAAASGLAVVGVSMVLDGTIVGALVAGYALVHFSESVAIARLGRESGIPFPELWAVARRQPPMPTRRLLLHGELLQVIGDALLRENDLRRKSEATAEELSHMASHDPLTDLPNRALLADRLAGALALARRHRRPLAVLYLDIDRFKHINDSLGHVVGDRLLEAVARRLTQSVRSSDTVARQGGDEFVVVLSELASTEHAGKAAEKIVATLAAEPYDLGGHSLHVTVSIGISVFPDDSDDAGTLMTRADMALYHAKHMGRNCYQFFEPAFNMRAAERQSIEAGLHGALARSEFALVYQPKVNLKTGAVVGAEALIRWRHPVRGLVAPADFVAIAEDCGLISRIGRWVLHEACRQGRAWQQAGLPPVPVSVNISAVEFRSKGFLNNVIEVLKETGLDPHCLEIELTESVLMAHVADTRTALHTLKELGVQLSIDDFGTGWSSLSYLGLYPIDALKIDKSFVQAVTSSSTAAPIVSAVISLGRSLRLRVIAEGVETREQVAFLRAEGCAEGQGYFFSRPVFADQLAGVLAVGRMDCDSPVASGAE